MSQLIERLYGLHQEEMEKVSADGAAAAAAAAGKGIKFWPTVGKMMGAGAILGTGGYAMAKGLRAVDRAIDSRGKQKAFDNMLQEDSELRRLNSARPAKVRAHFSTLFRFNPEMAKDPLVASSFVKGTASQDVMTHKTVQDLVSAHKGYKETAPKMPGSMPVPKIRI